MKSIIAIIALSISTIASAQSLTQGYLLGSIRGTHNFIEYKGIDMTGTSDITFDVDYYVKAGRLTQAQYDTMYKCMDIKGDHALKVVTSKFKVDSVECVYAPNYLNVWRAYYLSK